MSRWRVPLLGFCFSLAILFAIDFKDVSKPDDYRLIAFVIFGLSSIGLAYLIVGAKNDN